MEHTLHTISCKLQQLLKTKSCSLDSRPLLKKTAYPNLDKAKVEEKTDLDTNFLPYAAFLVNCNFIFQNASQTTYFYSEKKNSLKT